MTQPSIAPAPAAPTPTAPTLDAPVQDRILILDFGSQFTQLIARRVRESGVYCEIMPATADPSRLQAFGARAYILSGGPASVLDTAGPRVPALVFDSGLPVLGICYGQQAMCMQLGGEVSLSDHQEFGAATVQVDADCELFHGAWAAGGREQVWMSHGDRVAVAAQLHPPRGRAAGRLEHGRLPRGPGGAHPPAGRLRPGDLRPVGRGGQLGGGGADP